MAPTRKKQTAGKTSIRKKAPAKKKPVAQKTPRSKAAEPEKKKKATAIPEDIKGFRIVGIGASAGGLEALETFFYHMPSDSGMAFVIIQHLSPTHKSIMASLLSKNTKMEVMEVKDGMKVEPNRVYLNPPNKNVSIIQGTLQLMEPIRTKSINLPIDYFFRSISEELREKAICIILSGTATDGTLGIKAVKGEGGMVMVQSPESAKYDGMPRSAIDTGLVDFILSVEQMPGELIRYVRHPYIEGPAEIYVGESQFKTYIPKIFALIRTATGHDLSNYKETTISRRVERRMAVHQIQKISDYVSYLQRTQAEVEILFKDLLIGVTNFFRDTEAFQVLKDRVFPGLFRKKDTDTPIRVWVVGCSTGEEAYSMAMLLQETMDMLKKHFNVQIFASDIDSEAINSARLGIYPESIATDVSNERLNQFFVKEENTYIVKKQLREMIVFSVHNLIKDPPFSKMDLVSCRNLLIYMDTVLQKKILPLFHYAMNLEGILFLGTSESIGEFTDMFTPIDSKQKIFKRRAIHFERAATDYPAVPIYAVQQVESREDAKRHPFETDVLHVAERIILDTYAPPAVLINEKYDVVQFIGETDRYLRTPSGKASFNILKMAREGLQYKLSTALRDAIRQKKTISIQRLRIKHNSDFRVVDVTVRPLLEKSFPQDYMMIIFNDKTIKEPLAGEKGKQDMNEAHDPTVAGLEQELASTKEYLQTTIEELETSNEELKSTNEELQSVNEELQSTNEELETSKEELQSTNEELITVNTELQNKVDELSQVNNDINNLLSSTDIGTMFLDASLCIKRFTPPMTGIFNLIQTDIGRPINDITSKIKYDSLDKDSEEVLKTLVLKESEIKTEGGGWYSMRVLPYRTTENVIDGVVITFMDISRIKKMEMLEKEIKLRRKAEKELRESEANMRRLATVVMGSNDAITVQGFEGNITAWNRGAEKMYGYSEDKALKMNIRDLIPEDKREEALAFVKKIQEGRDVKSFETQRLTKDGKRLNVWLSVTTLFDNSGKPVEIAATERDLQWLAKE